MNQFHGIFFFSALYYNNGGTSFNSSGRSSNCDEDDMQSNISLEEDVNDLNQKVRITFFCENNFNKFRETDIEKKINQNKVFWLISIRR